MVDELFKMSPDSIQSSILKKPPTPSTQKRLSKTSSLDRPDVQAATPVNIEQIGNLIGRLVAASNDIRQFQKNFGEDRDKERVRRNSIRRAISIENGVTSDNERSIGGRLSKSSTQNGNLYRKSLSVDQSLGGQNSKLWKNPNDSNSSIQSIDSELHYGGGGGINYARDTSLDSRLSGGSTQSDLPRVRKKKRGLMGKLKSLTKSSKNNDTDGSVSLLFSVAGCCFFIGILFSHTQNPIKQMHKHTHTH